MKACGLRITVSYHVQGDHSSGKLQKPGNARKIGTEVSEVSGINFAVLEYACYYFHFWVFRHKN